MKLSLPVLDVATGVNGDNTVDLTGSGSAIASIANTNTATVTLTGAIVAHGMTAGQTVVVDGISITTAALASAATATNAASALAAAIGANALFTATHAADATTLTVTKTATFDTALRDRANALEQVTAIDAALTTIMTQRSKLGAVSNRLDHSVSNLTNTVSNLSAGRGRIEDADFAAETTNLARTQILQQASTAMLAQANASKQNVLSLLQG